MIELTAKVYAGLILVLGVVGLLAGEKQFLSFLNVDLALDLTRLALAAMLLNALYGLRDIGAQTLGLLVVGVLYVGLAVFGFFDATAGGLLPDKLSLFDNIFHLVTGLAALAV